MKNKTKYKNQFLSKFEVKSFEQSTDEQGNAFGYIKGYAAVFGNQDLVDDVLLKGCFDKTLASGQRIRLLYQHKDSEVIGTVINTVVDEYGLYFEGRINLAVEKGEEAYALLKAGDLDSLSIGFKTIDSEFKQNESGEFIRYIKELDLIEVSVVTFPANPAAMISEVKSLEEEINSINDVEIALRSRGLSKKEAKTIIGKVKEFFSTCGDDENEKKEASRDDCELGAILSALNELKSNIK